MEGDDREPLLKLLAHLVEAGELSTSQMSMVRATVRLQAPSTAL